MAQLVHHELADLPRGHFALTETAQSMRDSRNRGLDAILLDRSLLQRFDETRAQLLLVEGLATAMTFDHERHDELGRLKGRETLTTGETFTPTADLSPFSGETRVVDLGLFVAAKRAIHNSDQA